MKQKVEANEKKTQKNKLYRLAYAKITVLCLSALLVAGLVVSLTNDLYAFVKPDCPISLTFDQPLTSEELAKALAREGVIANPTVFHLYIRSKGREETLSHLRGTVQLNSSMSYREILFALSTPPTDRSS